MLIIFYFSRFPIFLNLPFCPSTSTSHIYKFLTPTEEILLRNSCVVQSGRIQLSNLNSMSFSFLACYTACFWGPRWSKEAQWRALYYSPSCSCTNSWRTCELCRLIIFIHLYSWWAFDFLLLFGTWFDYDNHFLLNFCHFRNWIGSQLLLVCYMTRWKIQILLHLKE